MSNERKDHPFQDEMRSHGRSNRNGTYPITSQHDSSSEHGDSGDYARCTPPEPMIVKTDLTDKLGQGGGLDVTVICLADPLKPHIWRSGWRYSAIYCVIAI